MELKKDSSSSAQKPSLGLLVILVSALGVWVFSKFHAPNKQSDTSDTAKGKTDNEKASCQRQSRPPVVRVMVDSFPPSKTTPDQRKAKEKEKKFSKCFNRTVKALTVLLLVVVAGLTLLQWRASQRGADAAVRSADAAIRQAEQYSAKQDRPWLWVKMPDNIDVKVGKPITTSIEVFNYGEVPAVVRANIRVEADPMAIEKFREDARKNPKTAMRIEQDTPGVWQTILPAHEGYCKFPIKSLPPILTQEDYKRIIDGTVDVAVYGRIYYFSPGMVKQDQELNGIFCFHRLKTGQISACSNQDGGYTNWIY